MADAATDWDGFSRAILLRIVPSGYRLIDITDTRFPGVREHFSRLALKHVGSRPCLVGFCNDGQDPRAAAAAAAGWARANLVPTAIQRHVSPGVLVIALPGATASEPGMVPGTPVPAAVWFLDSGGRLRAGGHPPGTPSARAVRSAVAPLMRGQEPPTIGHVDVAERTRMAGGGGRRRFSFAVSPLVLLLLVYLGLRFLPGLLLPHQQQPRQDTQSTSCQQPACVSVGADQAGAVVSVSVGQRVQVAVRGALAPGCLSSSNATVLATVDCLSQGNGTDTTIVTAFEARTAGDAVVSATSAGGGASAFSVTIRVS